MVCAVVSDLSFLELFVTFLSVVFSNLVFSVCV
jgi:hypothetical protein